MGEGFKALHWRSDLNPWMDILVIVREVDFRRALEAILRGLESFFDEDSHPYMEYEECVEKALYEAGIDLHWTMVFDSDQDSEEYILCWNDLIETIGKAMDVEEIA